MTLLLYFVYWFFKKRPLPAPKRNKDSTTIETKIACILKANEAVCFSGSDAFLVNNRSNNRASPMRQNTYAYGVNSASPWGCFEESTTAFL